MTATPENTQENPTSSIGEVPQTVAATAPAPAQPAKPIHAEPLTVTILTLYSTVIIVSLLTSALSIFAYDRLYATHIGSYDLPGHILWLRNDLVAKIQSGSVNEQQAKDLMAKDLDGVSAMIKALPSNLIVLSGDTVIGTPKRLVSIPDKTSDNAKTIPSAGANGLPGVSGVANSQAVQK
jgi:hypothetical protein